MVHWSFILDQGRLLSNHFCKALLKLSPSKFCHGTQSSADAPIVPLLWKSPAMLSSSKNNAYLGKTNLTCFTKLIAVQPSMAKYEWTMYQIKSVLLYLFSVLRNFESNRGFLLRNSIELILKTWKKLISTCFTKIIAEQSSVIQYAWPMYHMKEK